jgi:hypothetical protein
VIDRLTIFQYEELLEIVSDKYIEDEERLEHLKDLIDDVFDLRASSTKLMRMTWAMIKNRKRNTVAFLLHAIK